MAVNYLLRKIRKEIKKPKSRMGFDNSSPERMRAIKEKADNN